jgi:hypothetical protein
MAASPEVGEAEWTSCTPVRRLRLMPMPVSSRHDALPHSSDIPRIPAPLGVIFRSHQGEAQRNSIVAIAHREGRRFTHTRACAHFPRRPAPASCSGMAGRLGKPSQASRPVEGCLARPPAAESPKPSTVAGSIGPSKSSPGPPPTWAPVRLAVQTTWVARHEPRRHLRHLRGVIPQGCRPALPPNTEGRRLGGRCAGEA